MIPTIMIPVSDSLLSKINPDEMQLFFPLLLLFSIYIGITYFLLIKNTDLKKTSLFLKLILAHFIMYPLMGLLESLFWGDAFKGVEVNEFIRIFYRFTITFTLFTAFLSLLAKGEATSLPTHLQKENYKQVSIKILLIALVYFIIYNLFGYFIAWQFEETRMFYTGSAEQIGFLKSMLQNISDPSFVLVHTFRGILFALAGYLLHTIIRCSRIKKVEIMALLFGGFGFQIILPNPLLPEMVRISHFIETTISMLVFGAIVGLIFTYKKRINLPAALMILLLASSCQREYEIRYGFDSQFNKDSYGLTIMNVNRSSQLVTLEGEISVSEGEFQVDLINPEGIKEFSAIIIGQNKIDVSEAYTTKTGNWKLKYQSLNGVGTINLHMNTTN
jgi:hypothetical protein